MSTSRSAKTRAPHHSRIDCAAFALFALIAAGCGGGSSGNGSPPGISPPPPPTSPTQFGNLQINQDTATIVPLSVSVAEGILAIAQTAANEVLIIASPAGASVRNCQSSGTAVVLHDDLDSSFSVSAGDTITVSYDNCFIPQVDGNISGSIALSVSSIQTTDTNASISASMDIDAPFTITDPLDPALIVDVEASMDIEFSIDPSEFLAARTNVGDQLTIGNAGVVETITDFEVTRTALTSDPDPGFGDFDFTIAFDMFIASMILEGTATCETDPVMEMGGANVDSAEILCRGLNGSGARIMNGSAVSVDPEGDGSFTTFATVQWGEVIDGFLGEYSRLRLSDLFSELMTFRIPLEPKDVIYDEVRDRVLVATSTNSTGAADSLISIGLQQSTQTVLTNFDREPSSVALSADGSLLYAGFTDHNEIRKYDAVTMQLLSTMQITSDDIASNEYGVLDIAVSPLSANTIAVAFYYVGTGVTDVAIFVDDTQLPSRVRSIAGSPIAGEGVIYSEDGLRVHSFCPPRAANCQSIGLLIDATGVAETFEQRGFGASVELANGSVISHGSEYDAETFVELGTFAWQAQVAAIDQINRRYYSESNGSFEVWELDRRLPIASYQLGFGEDFDDDVLGLITAANFVLFETPNDIRVLDTAQIEDQPAESCGAVTEQSIDGADYTRIACDATDAVYSAMTDRVYVALPQDVAVNGNSIAVIDPSTNNVDAYIPVPSNPKRVVLSADSSRLYVTFIEAELLVAIDTGTNSIADMWQLGIVTDQGGYNTLDPRQALQIAASPVEPDTVVIVASEFINTLDKEFVVFRDGVRLADEMPISDLSSNTSNPYPRILFDGNGLPYALHADGQDPYFQTLSLTPIGIDATPAVFDATGVIWFPYETSVDGADVYFPIGDVANVVDQTFERRFDENNFPFAEINSAEGVYSDVTNDDVWFAALASFQSTGLIRFDDTDGSVTGSLEFLVRPWGRNGAFSHVSMFNIGTNRLGLIIDEREGLFIVDKSVVQ